MSGTISFKSLLRYLWREEIRVQMVMTGRFAFHFFPVMIAFFGFVLGIAMPTIWKLVPYSMTLLLAHFIFLLFGVGVGGFGLFLEHVLERRFGKVHLLLQSPRTLPVLYRKLMGAFYVKDALYYLAFNLLPLVLGFFFASFVVGYSPLGLVMLGLGSTLTFLFGMSLSYFLSMASVRSRGLAALSGLLLGLSLALVLFECIPAGLFLPGLPLQTGSRFEFVILGVVLTTILTVLGTSLTREHPRFRSEVFSAAYIPTVRRFGAFKSFAWLLAREWLDLKRSKTLGPVVGSFFAPIMLLVFLSWMMRVLMGPPGFPLAFYAPLIGFFCVTTYSWLNNIDSPGFYRLVPVRLPQVIKAKLALFFLLVAPMPAIFVLLLAWVTGDTATVWLALLESYATAVYMVALTAYLTGLRTNSYLFDPRILATFSAAAIPPLLVLTFLSFELSNGNGGGLALIASIAISCMLLAASFPMFMGIERRWAGETFD